MTVSYQHSFRSVPTSLPLIEGVRLGRNWHNDSDETWSNFKKANLVLEKRIFTNSKSLLLSVAVLCASPDTPRMLTVRSPGHAPYRLKIESSKMQVITVPSPVFFANEATAEISLEIDQLQSPYVLGISPDERQLGVRLLSVSAADCKPQFPLDLTQENAVDTILRQGWANFEHAFGSWSIEESTMLRLPGHLNSGKPMIVGLNVEYLERTANLPELQLNIRDQINSAQSFTLNAGGVQLLGYKINEWPLNTDLVLKIRFKNLLSPKDLGYNADPRLIGVVIKQIVDLS